MSTCTAVMVNSTGLANYSSTSASASADDDSTEGSAIYDLSGIYEDSGEVVSGRAVYYEVDDGSVLYWTRLSGSSGRRQLADAGTIHVVYHSVREYCTGIV